MLSPPQLYGIVGTLLKRHTSDDTFFAIMALVNAYVETVPFVANQVLLVKGGIVLIEDKAVAIGPLVNAYVETVPFVASQVLEDGGHNAVRGALIWL